MELLQQPFDDVFELNSHAQKDEHNFYACLQRLGLIYV